MKKLLCGVALASLVSGAAMAEDSVKLGVGIFAFDDVWTSVLRNGIADYAASIGVDAQVEDGQNDVAKQLDQIKNFVASGVSAIVVQPVDTSATQAMSDAAEAAGIPLVFVNRQPVNIDTLPDNQAFVASNEVDSGTLQTIQMCDNWAAEGQTEVNAYIMIGDLANQGAIQRTKDVHDVIAAGKCKVKLNIIDEQTANWQRDAAANLMTNWLTNGTPFDGVIANNDEMALGAIQAMKAAGIDMATVQVGGIDATQEALVAMQAGDLDVTVFQDAAGQGKAAVDAAVALAKGEAVDKTVWVPFVLVTPDNVADFVTKN
jgi:inositol transport system substrate-binding protein